MRPCVAPLFAPLRRLPGPAIAAGPFQDTVATDRAVAALTGISGVVVIVRMYETHPRGSDPSPLAKAAAAG